MSSINPYFTFNYAQPEAYRFSHDSVFLARAVFELMKKPVRVGLDLCAGSGVVGLDLLHHLRAENARLERFDFIDVQDDYRVFIEENFRRLEDARTKLEFLELNYADMLNESFKNRYDLIVCNPPYFREGQGSYSPDKFKNRCRFFLDSDFATLWRAIGHALASGGEAFVLLRDLSEHGIDTLAEARAVVGAELEIVRDIRGTSLVRFSK